jgi:hypothetical protein
MMGTKSKSRKKALSSGRLSHRAKMGRRSIPAKSKSGPGNATSERTERRPRKPNSFPDKQHPNETRKDAATPIESDHAPHEGLQYPFSPYSVIQSEVEILMGRETEEDARIVRENELFGHCEEIASLLEKHWHEIGWDLQRLRNPSMTHTPENIREAFEPLRGKDREFLFAPLLHPTSIPATHVQVRNTLKALEKAGNSLESFRRAIEPQTQKYEETKRAVQQASLKNRKSLGKEIARRKGNLARLRSECHAKETLIATLQKKVLTADPRRTKTIETRLSRYRREYAKLKESFGPEEPEEKLIRDLEKQRDNATKQNWLLAKEAAEECQNQAKGIGSAGSEAQEGNKPTPRSLQGPGSGLRPERSLQPHRKTSMPPRSPAAGKGDSRATGHTLP